MNFRNAEIRRLIERDARRRREPDFFIERAAADAEFVAQMRIVNDEITRRAGCSGAEWRASGIIQSEPAIRAAYEKRLRANGEFFVEDI